jgi:hypothetical protein
MRPYLRLLSIIIIIGILCSSCSVFSEPTVEPSQPSVPFPIDEPTPLPLAEISITISVPAGTPDNAKISLELLDEITGWPYNAELFPLSKRSDGRWEIKLTPPAGSLLRYRYLRQDPGPAVEAGTDGLPIRYRTLLVPGSAQVEDIIAAWTDLPYQGATGRILGQFIDKESGHPIAEMIASVAGQIVFSDSEGLFRVDRLVPGLHRITAFSPDGSYKQAQQGAIIAADSTTPAHMELEKAKRIQVTFEVAVPEGTPSEMPVRIAGNIQQLGLIFTDYLSGNTSGTSQMATMIEVDPTHYIQIIDLYAGIDLKYKYTVGDALINAERDQKGNFRTRQIVLPDHDVIVRDAVSSWQGKDHGSVTFHVTVPPETPATDQISIQFKQGGWSPPMPMISFGQNEWFFKLYSLADVRSPAEYRYCRNMQCGIADDIETPGDVAPGRSFIPGPGTQEIRDSVQAWIWWNELDSTMSFDPPQFGARSDFELGFEFLPKYSTTWNPFLEQAFIEIATTGANAVILTPSWTVNTNHTIPILDFDPVYSPFKENLVAIIRSAQQNGLAVIFHPTLSFPKESSALWWQLSIRDENWWTVWFERYKAFILTYAHIAQETSVSKIVLGEPQVQPAYPDGVLVDGSPSGVPAIASSHWQALISEIRSIYSGRIAVEVELSDTLQPLPSFLESVDELHLYWHPPLSTQGSSLPEMQVAARNYLNNLVLNQPTIMGKPILLSVEYPSVTGGTGECMVGDDGSCLSAAQFDQGAYVHPDFQTNMQEQAEAMTAVLTEGYYQSAITGFYARRYNPVVGLQDRSASVNGKLALAILKILYQGIGSP